MRRVEKEAARMGLLVEDLLLLARLDQQRPLARQPVDLLVLAADAVHDARLLAPDRGYRPDGPAGRGVPGHRRRAEAAAGHREPDEQRADAYPGGDPDRGVDQLRGPRPAGQRSDAGRACST